jgi:hypothetical protein
MTTPFTGLFIDASCNSRFSHVKETDSRYRIMFVDSENNTFSFQSNNGDLVLLKPLGINHVHRPTHASHTVCVFYYCRTYDKVVRVGGGGEWRTCAMRDDEPRPVWMSLLITHWDP